MSAVEKKKYIKELQKQGMSPSQARKLAEMKSNMDKEEGK